MIIRTITYQEKNQSKVCDNFVEEIRKYIENVFYIKNKKNI